MSNENANTQTPVAPPAPPAGPSVEELQAKAAELEKSREGLLRDLQEERRKRQEAEQRLAPPAPSAAPEQDVTGDELYKVVAPVLEKHPMFKKVKEIEAREAAERERIQLENAKTFLTNKTGRKWEEIDKDSAFQTRLADVAKRYKLVGTVDDITQRAYSILELEDLKVKEAERERAHKASANASMPSGSAPALEVSGKEYATDEFNRMATSEYMALSSKGSFKKVGDKIVYTPHS